MWQIYEYECSEWRDFGGERTGHVYVDPDVWLLQWSQLHSSSLMSVCTGASHVLSLRMLDAIDFYVDYMIK